MKTAECEHGSIYFSNTTLSHVKYNVLSACLFGWFHILASVALVLTTPIVIRLLDWGKHDWITHPEEFIFAPTS